MKRIAIVVFNLGGPDAPGAVRPFLINLFSDPAIIRLPWPIRWPLARLIADRRLPVAREIYRKLGGASPILKETVVQAQALEREVSDVGVAKVFIAMRYWNPRARETVQAVKRFDPDEIVLLPLYPHYSTATTDSSLGEWKRLARKGGITARQREVRSFPREPGFIAAIVQAIAAARAKVPNARDLRLLFSAHGLPRRIVDRGDPYPQEVSASVTAIVEQLARDDLDWVICYQSRVGPLKWLEPSIETEIRRAAQDRKGVIVVPIAFVSEHSETLVELDIDYRRLAQELDLPAYIRIPTVGADAGFIAGLADLVRQALMEG